MKNTFKSNLLLYYATVASVFIVISGFLNTTGDDSVFQILFLPVALYLVGETLTTFRKKSKASDQQVKGKKTYLFVILYLILLGIGMFSIKENVKENTQTTSASKTIFSVGPSKSYDTSVIADSVLYEEPSVTSVELAALEASDKVRLLEENNEWTKVETPNGVQGYILSSSIITLEEQQPTNSENSEDLNQ